jgi:hypothetical protein
LIPTPCAPSPSIGVGASLTLARNIMKIPRNPHQNRIVVDAIEWAARLERLAGMPRFPTEQSSSRQDEKPNSGASASTSPAAK